MDDSTPIDTIRDLYTKCMERLEFLSSREPYASHSWEAEFDRLRIWGQNLERSPGLSPSPLEDQLQSSLPLQNRLLEALEGLFTGLKAFTDKLQRTNASGFKIAGIDVLSANGGEDRQNAARLDDITRRLHVTTRDINTLYSIFNAPSRPLSNGRLMPRPQRSYSNRDDPYEPNELISSASASPMAPPSSRSKRTRGDSQSSRDESVYSSSAYRVSSGSESLSQRYSDARYSDTRYSDSRFSDQRYSDLPSIHSIPSKESLDPSPYDPHSSTGSRLSGPYYGPPAGIQPQGPTTMYPIPDQPLPYMSYEPSRSRDSRSDDPLAYHEQGPIGSHSPHSERALSRGATRSMGRLRMTGDSGDDGSSGTPTPKLTKTGRVSKALRGEPVHACNLCDKVYTRAEHLRRHRQNHRERASAPLMT